MKRPTLLVVLSFCAVAVVVTSAQVRPAVRPISAAPTAPRLAGAADPEWSAPFFDGSVLHDIELEMNSKDWQTLKENYLSNEYYPSDFRWGVQTLRNIGIRSRGTASRSGVKPGLRVDFNRYSAEQTFLGLTSFVLRNNTTDRTGMHERVSMLLFERMGVPAPREAHTRLFVNGAYVGVYSIVESIDKNFLARTRNENDGYLYKFDRNVGDDPYFMTYGGPNSDLYVPHPFKPETHEADPHPEPIVDMIRTVAEASDANFRDAIGQFLDLGAFVRHVAIEMFLNESDGVLGDAGTTNFYLYRPLNSNLHVFIPWDKSETMRDRTRSIFHNVNDVPEQIQNRIMTRAMKYPDLATLYLDVLKAAADSAAELTEGDGRGWMEREIGREFNQIRDAVFADPEKPCTNDEFLQAVDDLRKFSQDRPIFVTASVLDKRGQHIMPSSFFVTVRRNP
jgi:spore coat protein CotH